MFRSTFSQFRHQKITKSSFSSIPVRENAKPDDLNHVKLVGYLASETFQFKKSGINSLTVKTINSPDSYSMHKVHTLGFENLKAGQRLQVSGMLRCEPFKSENGKVRERLYVRAKKIILLEDQKNSQSVDCNHIDIVGNVADKIIDIDYFSIIKLAIHYNRGVDDKMIENTSFLSVFLYDEKLREFARSLEVSDRISICGALGYKANSFSTGKTIYSGFILPKTIEKLIWNRYKRNAEPAVGM